MYIYIVRYIQFVKFLKIVTIELQCVEKDMLIRHRVKR